MYKRKYMSRYFVLLFFVVFSVVLSTMCSKENIAYYDCPTSEISKSLSEKKAAFDNNPTEATCQAYFTDLSKIFKDCEKRLSKAEAEGYTTILEELQPCSQFD